MLVQVHFAVQRNGSPWTRRRCVRSLPENSGDLDRRWSRSGSAGSPWAATRPSISIKIRSAGAKARAPVVQDVHRVLLADPHAQC